MRCIGTLEFVTDFHNKCHQTQHQLLIAKEHSRKIANVDIDAESDKENTSPADPLMQIGHTTTGITDSIVRAIDSVEYGASGYFRDRQGVAKYGTIWTESKITKREKSGSVIGASETKSLCSKEAAPSWECDTAILRNQKLPETRAQKKRVNGNEQSKPLISCLKRRRRMPKKTESARRNCRKAPLSISRETKVDDRIVTDNSDDLFNMKTAPMDAKKPALVPLENVLAPTSKELTQNFSAQPTTKNLQPGENADKMQVKEGEVFEGWLENKPVGDELDIVGASQGYLKTKEAPEHLVLFSKELSENVEPNVGHFRDRRKKSEGQFGKLSELITNEQKKVIETLYTINMDVVDDVEVYRNITILDKLKFKCKLCGKTYPRMDKCQVHVWGHLNMKPYSCKSCDFVTLTISNIRCHIRKRHLKIKPFQCNLCEKTYATAVLLEEHINSHTGAKPYLCKLCDFATANRQVLSYHRTTHKPAKDISCEVCGKKFFSNCRMRAHMITHNKDKALKCKLCSTYLCNAEALEKHCQKVHARDYICNICGLRTRSKKALTNHENVHSAAKYRCSLCSNAYKSRHMLKEHLLKHQGIRKYKCELCQKSFAQQSHIAAHMSVHMGKRYPCPGCNKLFNRRDNMRMHTKRCELFKSKPDCKNYFSEQSSARPLVEDDRLAAVTVTDSSGTPKATKSTENSKTDKEKQKTELALKATDFSRNKTDSSDSPNLKEDFSREDYFVQFRNDDDGILQFGGVEIFPLSNPIASNLQSEGNMAITETVLRPECL